MVVLRVWNQRGHYSLLRQFATEMWALEFLDSARTFPRHDHSHGTETPQGSEAAQGCWNRKLKGVLCGSIISRGIGGLRSRALHLQPSLALIIFFFFFFRVNVYCARVCITHITHCYPRDRRCRLGMFDVGLLILVLIGSQPLLSFSSSLDKSLASSTSPSTSPLHSFSYFWFPVTLGGGLVVHRAEGGGGALEMGDGQRS